MQIEIILESLFPVPLISSDWGRPQEYCSSAGSGWQAPAES